MTLRSAKYCGIIRSITVEVALRHDNTNVNPKPRSLKALLRVLLNCLGSRLSAVGSFPPGRACAGNLVTALGGCAGLLRESEP